MDRETYDEVVEILRGACPYGHEDFIPKTLEEVELHSTKNFDYAAGGDPLGNFDRVAAIFALYPGLKLSDPVVYLFSLVMKQIDEVLWSKSRGFEGQVEGISKRLIDVSVYTKIAQILEERNR